MKTKLLVLFVMIGAAIALTGCFSTAAQVSFSNDGTFGENILIPAKDFESKGLVFTMVEFVAGTKAFEGEVFTYQALLKEAQKVDADAVINIVIDKKFESMTQGMNTNQKETWYASALAIKYTTTLKSTTTTNVTATGTTTTSEEPVMNGAGAGSSLGGGLSLGGDSGGGLFGGILGKK
jgi:hypothetical protein